MKFHVREKPVWPREMKKLLLDLPFNLCYATAPVLMPVYHLPVDDDIVHTFAEWFLFSFDYNSLTIRV